MMTRETILEGLKRGETMIIQESFPEYAIVLELQAQGLVTITPGEHGLEVNWNGNNNPDKRQQGTAPDRSEAVLPSSTGTSTPV